MDIFLILLIIFIPLIAQLGITTSYNKYKKVNNSKNLTGYDVARTILDRNGLKDVYIVETRGNLTDHYDPTQKVVRLSSDIYHGDSIASMAVAAHECGHAIQDKEAYVFMRFRSLIFPVVNIATSISYYIILIGFILQIMNMIYLGIALTFIGLIFQIVTLPVEFNASKRADVVLEEYGLCTSADLKGTKTVLKAAAMTYVAGVLASALQIVRLILAADRDN